MKELKVYSTSSSTSISTFVNKNNIQQADIQNILIDSINLMYVLYYWEKIVIKGETAFG